MITLEVFIIVGGLGLVLGLVVALARLGIRLAVLAIEVASVSARVLAPPAGRALIRLAVGGARVARRRVGPALWAGCAWLGDHVLAAAAAASNGMAGAARRLSHKVAAERASSRRPPDG